MAINAGITDVNEAQRVVAELSKATAEFGTLANACKTCASACSGLKGTLNLSDSVVELMDTLGPVFAELTLQLEEANKCLKGWTDGFATAQEAVKNVHF